MENKFFRAFPFFFKKMSENNIEEISSVSTTDWDKDTQDEGNHLNIYGAEKVGKYIATYLKNNYNLDDHRNDEKYQKWNDELENYKKQKEIVKENGHG